jgi:hypothetical protein
MRRPSRLRFLAGAAVGVAALLAVVSLAHFEASFCAHLKRTLPSCSMFPPWVFQLGVFVAVAGCAFSVYRWYRDFQVGEYYVDLADSQRTSRRR